MSHIHVNEVLKIAAMGDGSGPPGGVGRGMGPGGGTRSGAGLGRGAEAPRANASKNDSFPMGEALGLIPAGAAAGAATGAGAGLINKLMGKPARSIGRSAGIGGAVGGTIGASALGLLALSHILGKVDPSGEKTVRVMQMTPAVVETAGAVKGLQGKNENS